LSRVSASAIASSPSPPRQESPYFHACSASPSCAGTECRAGLGTDQSTDGLPRGSQGNDAIWSRLGASRARSGRGREESVCPVARAGRGRRGAGRSTPRRRRRRWSRLLQLVEILEVVVARHPDEDRPVLRVRHRRLLPSRAACPTRGRDVETLATSLDFSVPRAALSVALRAGACRISLRAMLPPCAGARAT
jgi:hypothetical protein